MSLIQIFIMKLIDNGLSTVKTVYMHKEKYFREALFNALSTFFYLIAIVQITKDNSLSSIITMCVATFLGTLLPGILIKKSERDKLCIYDITANNLENGKHFADIIREYNIPIKTYVSYDSDMKKVLICKIYCPGRLESKIVLESIPELFKYHVYIQINE